nr:MAG TPA_asm: holin family protein [Caudoviricetes sp.]
MENLLQNIASGLWIVLGVYCFFGLRKWNKRYPPEVFR